MSTHIHKLSSLRAPAKAHLAREQKMFVPAKMRRVTQGENRSSNCPEEVPKWHPKGVGFTGVHRGKGWAHGSTIVCLYGMQGPWIQSPALLQKIKSRVSCSLTCNPSTLRTEVEDWEFGTNLGCLSSSGPVFNP